MQFKGKFVHPFLIAAYPVLALLAHNIEEIKATIALRALLVSLLLAAALILFFKLVLRDWNKATLASSFSLILFFTYGHIYNAIEQVAFFGTNLGRHRLLGPLWLILLVSGIWWISRSSRNTLPLQRTFTIVAMVALAFPLAQIGLYGLRTIIASPESAYQREQFSALAAPAGGVKPDIYYIILDAYARDDAMQAIFDLDNIPFLEELSGLGFYVARCAQSNYAQTQLSLASSLNLDYLQNLSDVYQPGSTSRVGISELIHHNAVRQALEAMGYQSVAFETGFKGTQWEDADIYLAPNINPLKEAEIWGGINGFEVLALRDTAGLLLIDGAGLVPGFLRPDFSNPRQVHRQRVLFDLEQLRQMPELPGPKFVFAHLVIPHPPYVFGPDGEFTDYDREDIPGYRDQVTYLNNQLVPLLKEIIARSSTPPIIILQADHGAINAPPRDRLSIFSAYYLPGGADQQLYEGITPVNTFRLIFDAYFAGEFGLLEDVAYFSVYNAPYDFTIIPNDRPGCVK
jgi:hypothetical protein